MRAFISRAKYKWEGCKQETNGSLKLVFQIFPFVLCYCRGEVLVCCIHVAFQEMGAEMVEWLRGQVIQRNFVNWFDRVFQFRTSQSKK